MKESKHLAIDLGAETGRVIEGSIRDGKLFMKEIWRFPTGMTILSGSYYWNVYRMYEEILKGLEKAVSIRTGPWASVGVDTWGVDYGLLDKSGKLIGLPHAYRDHRTDNILSDFGRTFPLDRVYDLTGVQLLTFNTLFQLFAEVRDHRGSFEHVRDLLFMPDLFNYFLTGLKRTEFTLATTSQLFDPTRRQWEAILFEHLGIPQGIMQQISEPCTVLGELSHNSSIPLIMKGLPVVSVASHDTASAIAAIPAKGDNWAFMSTGTWALVGFEHETPMINRETRALNFTNEGGIHGYRVLKNMMGFWILQECRRMWGGDDHSYEKLTRSAEIARPFGFFIDPDDPRFFNPLSMPDAIATFCQESGQEIPVEKPDVVRGVLESLALKTRKIIDEVNKVRGKLVDKIYITGGGVRNDLFCQFVANATGLEVYAVLPEGTAAGNILAQAIATSNLESLEQGRMLVDKSIQQVVYHPGDSDQWAHAYHEFLKKTKETN